jgi:hypothetical protein
LRIYTQVRSEEIEASVPTRVLNPSAPAQLGDNVFLLRKRG